ncbi:Glycosyl transferases group 1 [Streptomyces sp. Termitarium-T10T-6]|nr:Glycosyl transferases group 1 [Streptomyces sp. Termitarium-T10T-6]
MAGFYASLDAFALPSVAEESFGISQAEAMMLGVPSVASDAPGMRVPVTETGFGRLFPPGDAHALAAALREVAAYPPERRAEGGRVARARYGTDHCLDAYDGLFREAGALRGTQGARA